jgi:type I restriction enzyme, S subunit
LINRVWSGICSGRDGPEAVSWLERFHFRTNDDLERLATVDMAMEDLRRAGKPVTADAVKKIIHDHPKWKAKLDRAVFSDDNIAKAVKECQTLFPPSRGRPNG